MEQKFTIVIGRQMGSGGKAIADSLAERLNVKVYDTELINEVAKQSGMCSDVFAKVDERPARSSFFSMLSSRLSLNSYGSVEGMNPLSDDSLFMMQSEVIKDIARRESCVFVGRCADYILRNEPNVLSVFICASLEQRIERMAKINGVDAHAAEEILKSQERERAAYYNSYTFKRWGAAESYHLCIDTTAIGIDATADMIIDYLRRMVK